MIFGCVASSVVRTARCQWVLNCLRVLCDAEVLVDLLLSGAFRVNTYIYVNCIRCFGALFTGKLHVACVRA